MTVTNYEQFLPQGKENAISSTELCAILGFENTRALQLDIARARENGQVILSATTGGYYLPKDNAEIEEFIAILRARAINTFKALKSARKRLEKLAGQETLFEESEVCIDECTSI